MAEDADQSELPLPEDEVTGGAVHAASRAYRGWRGWVESRLPSRVGPDAALPWFVPLLTAAVAVVTKALPLLLATHLTPPVPELRLSPMTVARVVRALVPQVWYGAALGLGLVLADRYAGGWRRPLRWAVGAGLIGQLLGILVPNPEWWWDLFRDWGTGAASSFLQFYGRPWWMWLSLLPDLAIWAFAGFWLARAVPSGGAPHRALARAGAQAGVVTSVVSMVVTLPWAVRALMAAPVSWPQVATGAALQVGVEVVHLALIGLAVAIGLWHVRPRPVPEPEPTPEADPESPPA